MITQNLHTHTIFSDGKSTPEEIIKSAIDSGLQSLGFSDHAPVPFQNSFSIAEGELSNYIAKIEQLKSEFADQIEILLSLEVDHIPALMDDFFIQNPEVNLDYTIGSVHLVGVDSPENLWFIDGPKREIYDDGLQQFFGGDIRLAVKAFYHQTNRMLEQQTPDIIGHLDLIKIWGHNPIKKSPYAYAEPVLKKIRASGLVVEINSAGLRKPVKEIYPSREIMEQMFRLSIPVTLGSDAHNPQQVGEGLENCVELLKKIGYRSMICFERRKHRVIPLDL